MVCQQINKPNVSKWSKLGLRNKTSQRTYELSRTSVKKVVSVAGEGVKELKLSRDPGFESWHHLPPQELLRMALKAKNVATIF